MVLFCLFCSGRRADCSGRVYFFPYRKPGLCRGHRHCCNFAELLQCQPFRVRLFHGNRLCDCSGRYCSGFGGGNPIFDKNDNLAYAFSFILLLAIAAVCFIDSSKFEGLLPRIMEKLSLFERFYTFVNGVFDMTAIVYFLSVIVFFLFLSVQSLEKRRYN